MKFWEEQKSKICLSVFYTIYVIKRFIELKIFNLKPNDIIFESIGVHNLLKPGDDIYKIDILFKKIEKIDDWFSLPFRSWTIIREY